MRTTSTAYVEAIDWNVGRPGGGVVVATRVTDQTLIVIDRSQEAALPDGAQLLSSFLDDFDALPEIAEGLPATRMEVAGLRMQKRGGPTLRDLRQLCGLSQAAFATAPPNEPVARLVTGIPKR